ncbi:hypothetical protein, partial [Mucilaginibacter yixingensis]|uniref:hypothetical protein n=1 Tax=Mucilaginibacter yixingensis TaxID=1295612 RepID=UPI001B85C7E4
GQFPPKSGGHFPAESVVSLRRNQVVNISEFSNILLLDLYHCPKFLNWSVFLQIVAVRRLR